MRTYYSSQTLAYVSLNLTCNLAVGFFIQATCMISHGQAVSMIRKAI